ncbi:hypothetical protein GCM10028773_23450 [Spirosoma koreense]
MQASDGHVQDTGHLFIGKPHQASDFIDASAQDTLSGLANKAGNWQNRLHKLGRNI